jgi:hypothetical protein
MQRPFRLHRPREEAAPPRRCQRCGTTAEPGQDVCLQCGARLGAPTVRDWITLALVLGLAALAGAAIAFGARNARRAETPTFVATSTQSTTTTAPAATIAPSSQPPPMTEATTTQQGPTITTGTLPRAPGAPSVSVETMPAPPATTPPTPTPTPAPTPPVPGPGGILAWPARSGYTVILQSLPESGGRAAALANARAAKRAGMTSVGVLLSSDYSSLRGGYWVVFAGVYDSSVQADDALAGAHAHGFVGAYPAHVAPR